MKIEKCNYKEFITSKDFDFIQILSVYNTTIKNPKVTESLNFMHIENKESRIEITFKCILAMYFIKETNLLRIIVEEEYCQC